MTSTGRSESIVPNQALFMMNSEFATILAIEMAGRLEREYSSLNEQINAAFRWAYSRPPTPEEFMASSEFFRDLKLELTPSPANSGASTDKLGNRPQVSRSPVSSRRGRYGATPDGDNKIESVMIQHTPLSAFCQMLMSSARFRILN